MRAGLEACTADIEKLRRALTNLRADLDQLREKIRG